MKIERSKMRTAERVLRLVVALLRDVPSPAPATLGAYQNGREQGYSLQTHKMFVCWAENRNSDQIVVYFGAHDPMQSISTSMYASARYFGPNEADRAAEYIANLLEEEAKP